MQSAGTPKRSTSSPPPRHEPHKMPGVNWTARAITLGAGPARVGRWIRDSLRHDRRSGNCSRGGMEGPHSSGVPAQETPRQVALDSTIADQ